MRRRVLIHGLVCAMAFSCGAPSEPAAGRGTAGGEEVLPDDAWADVVVGEGRGRPVAFVERAPEGAGEPASPAAAPGPSRPGAIDILIGRAATDVRELSEEELARSVPSGWEVDLETDEAGRPMSGRALHVVLNVPYESWSGDGTFVHLTAFSPAFEPAAGAEVYLDGRLVGRTEAHGTLAFRAQPLRSNEAVGGSLRVRWRGLEREVSFDANTRTDSFEQRTVYAYTDRGVYEPGQPIEVRAIAWRLRGEYRALEGARLTLELLDPSGRIVGGGPLETDRWGVGTSTLPLPAHASEGPYTLVAATGEERAQTRIIVQHFVAPVIEIRHDLGRFLTPASPLAANVRLGYFGGGDFEEGTLRMVIKVGDEELAQAELTVRGAGPHRIEIAPDALTRVRRRATEGDLVEAAFTVVDANERSDTVRRFMQYTQNPFQAVIELDRTRYAPGDPVIAMVRLVDLDDVPVRDREVVLEVPRGRAAGWRGTEPEIEAAFARGDEGSSHELRERTDPGGVARFRFPMPRLSEDFDSPTVRARVAEVAEPIAETDLPMAEPLPMRSAIDGTVVREGGSVEVEVLFPRDARPLEEVVHADVVDSSGAIIHSALVPIRGGRAVGRITAPSWGSMLLALYCVGRRGNEIGLMSDGQNLVVHPGERIRVRLGGLPVEARPGEHVRATVRVEAPDGSPREAIVGASVVDAAVISLLDPLERPPFDRFYNPERKVLATTGAQTLTWPVVNRTFGEERYDIAWPATFGWHGGPVVRRPERRLRRQAAGPMPPSTADDPMAELAGVGGGGTGEGTIGLGSLGTIGHGAGGGDGQGYGSGSGGLRSREDGAAAPEEEPPTTIVLRTRFEETSLWSPSLVTRGGETSFELDLPDAITAQRFTVVASDAEGGVATAHADVPVRQPLYVRSDLPPALTEGDRVRVGVAVRNLGREPAHARVALRSSHLEVERGEQDVDVPAEGTAVVWMDVRAPRPGEARYEVTADLRGGRTSLRDIEQRTLWVHPAGEPVREERAGVLGANEGWTERFSIDASDRHHVVTLAITMPSAAVALDEVERLLQSGYFGPDPAASRALAASAAYAYLERAGSLDAARRQRLRAQLAELTSSILVAQRDDGGWGWFWSGGASMPYVSVFAVQALLELRALGFPVSGDVLIRARSFLLGAAGADDRLDVAGIAPWVGRDARIERQTTAEMVHVLSRMPSALRDGDPRLARIAESLAGELERADVDPLTLAHVVGALHRLGASASIDDREARLARAVRRLSGIRSAVHWEPGWFSAWGGTVEAAAVTLEVLAELDDPAYEAARRDATRFLLHTRRSFGGWHNARGTAWAIRALTLVDPGVRDDRGTLVVRVDGREVRRAELDASDAFSSALALRQVEISGLEPGEHEVDVRYDGRMRPRVALRVLRWTAEERESATAFSIERAVASEARRGTPTDVTLRVRGAADAGPLVIELPMAPGLALEDTSIERARAAGAILDARRDGAGWVIGLPPGAQHEIALRLVGERPGQLTWAPARVRSALSPDEAGRSEAARITIR